MQGVIYVDILVFVNAIIGYLLLKCTAFFAGRVQKPLRMCAGALCAGFSALILLWPNLPIGIGVLFKISSAAFIILLAFPLEGWRIYLKAAFWYLALNIALGGIVILSMYSGAKHVVYNNLSLYIHISPVLLIGCIVGMYLLIQLFAYVFGKPQTPQTVQYKLSLKDCTLEGVALLDTGYHVKDSMTGKQTFLVSFPLVRQLLSERVQKILCGYFESTTITEGLYLSTISTATGMRALPTLQADLLVLGTRKFANTTVIFTSERFSAGEFTAIACAEIEEYR